MKASLFATGGAFAALALFGCSTLIGIGDLPSEDVPVFGRDAGLPSSSSGGASGSSSGSVESDGGHPGDGATIPTGDGSLGGDGAADRDSGPVGPVCNEAVCPNGCCNGNVCFGSSNSACGTHGIACADCTTQSLVCSVSGQCGTSTTSCDLFGCSNGCCSGGLGDAGSVCVTAVTPTTCGPGGEACIDCTTTGQVCASDATECVAPLPDGGPPVDAEAAGDAGAGDGGCASTCGGCCDDTGDCQAGTVDDVCGMQGAACEDCTASGGTCLLGLCLPN